ncbi:ABC transporter permease [Ruminococcaceae bacterium OttesenSCG-928-O06]|nr:ABC transporter permease [Ruminococcaceae bacterium OttesenSCG-928-O06]
MSRSAKVWRFVRKYPLAVLGALICLVFFVVAILAPAVATQDPFAQDLTARYAAPSSQHYFGTDNFGRDIFSRVVYGTRISMPAGFLVVIFSCIFGGIYGAIAGYFGKALDEVMMRIADIVMSFPSLVLAMALGAVFGKTMFNTIMIIVLVWWPKYARMMRGLVLTVRETEYVTSAVVLGERRMTILLRTIIPNCVAPLLVMASADLGAAILMFSGLGFLGMGVAPPAPEWGAMVSDGAAVLKSWWVSFFPGIAIFTVSVAFNFIGDALRDIMDPKLRNLD